MLEKNTEDLDATSCSQILASEDKENRSKSGESSSFDRCSSEPPMSALLQQRGCAERLRLCSERLISRKRKEPSVGAACSSANTSLGEQSQSSTDSYTSETNLIRERFSDRLVSPALVEYVTSFEELAMRPQERHSGPKVAVVDVCVKSSDNYQQVKAVKEIHKLPGPSDAVFASSPHVAQPLSLRKSDGLLSSKTEGRHLDMIGSPKFLSVSQDTKPLTSSFDAALLEELHSVQDEMSQKSGWDQKEVERRPACNDQATDKERHVLHPTASTTKFRSVSSPVPLTRTLYHSDSAALKLYSSQRTAFRHSVPLKKVRPSSAPHHEAIRAATAPPSAFSRKETYVRSFRSSSSEQEKIDESDNVGSVQQAGASLRTEFPKMPEANSEEATHGPFTRSDLGTKDRGNIKCPSSSQVECGDVPTTQNRSFRRTFSRTLSRNLRPYGLDDEFDEGGDSLFWDQVFDAESSFDAAGLDRWDLPDADLTLSQIEKTEDLDLNQTSVNFLTPQEMPAGAFKGFVTAANRHLPEPDALALERARRLFADEDDEQFFHRTSSGNARGPTSLNANQQQPVEDSSATAQRTVEEVALVDENMSDAGTMLTEAAPQYSSFQKANGKALQLSRSAIQAAEQKLAAWEAEENRQQPSSRVCEGSTSVHRSFSIGRKLEAVPASVRRASPPAAQKRTSLSPVPSSSVRVNRLSASQPENSGHCVDLDPYFLSPGPRQANSNSTEEGVETIALQALPPSTPGRTVVQRQFHATPASVRGAVSQMPSQPSVSQFISAAGKAGLRASFGTPVGRPQLDSRPSRISLGMTPRSKLPTIGSKASFRTPFKDGSRPSLASAPVAASSSAVLGTSRASIFLCGISVGSSSAICPNSPRPTQGNPTVFQLKAVVPRLSLRQYGMLPTANRAPLEKISIILANPVMAGRHVFQGLTGEDLGPQQILEELRRVGASHVHLLWVKNHWQLILWKLAAYANSKPEEAEVWWCFEQVARQILYRYEREINMAQRSAIKRIQEHDSPCGLPMVLCVFDVRRSRQTCDDEGEGRDKNYSASRVSRYGHVLELTDGWYRILAHIDGPLTRAVRKGRIRRGVKIALQGARLESYGAGPSDVLSAFDKSVLTLTGNSTSLASWDARLGFHRESMVATLRSLTADGGAIPCMDIIITRLFPVAYVDATAPGSAAGGSCSGREASGSGARGAAEEAERHRQWERRAEECRAALAAEYEKEIRSLRELQEMLVNCSTHGQIGRTTMRQHEAENESAADVDSQAALLFEQLVESASPLKLLNYQLAAIESSNAASLIDRLHELVASRIEALNSDSRSHLEAEFARRCPPRRVKSFRICRFVDAASTAEDGESLMRRSCKRTVQLTVWDLDSLEGRGEGGGIFNASSAGLNSHGLDDFLVVQGKYRVTNLIPTQRSSWRGPDVEADVFLSTRRGTRWKRLN